LLFSPVIGIVAGVVADRFQGADPIAMAIISLVSLYLTAALYGLGGGIVLALLHRTQLGNALGMTLILPWMMTIGGFVLWMWPLAYLNHGCRTPRLVLSRDFGPRTPFHVLSLVAAGELPVQNPVAHTEDAPVR
jgi:hypothetical protein